jgi:hypothetical protein
MTVEEAVMAMVEEMDLARPSAGYWSAKATTLLLFLWVRWIFPGLTHAYTVEILPITSIRAASPVFFFSGFGNTNIDLTRYPPFRTK